MKVLILSHSSDIVGAGKSMLELFDYWSKTTDIRPEFIIRVSIRKPLLNLADALRARNYKYHTIYYTNWAQRNPTNDPLEMYWYAKQNTKAVAKIEKIIKKVKPQVVMTNTIVAPWAAIAAYNQKIPHIWFIREFGEADSLDFRMGRSKTFEIVGQLSQLVVANSKALAAFATQYIDKTKMTVLYPYLDLNKINKLSKMEITSPYKDPSSLKLIVTGRIAPAKGQVIAALAVGILNNQGINCELCIVGSPSDIGDDATLLSAIEKYNIADKVHLVGYQPNPLAYVALADIGITPSRKEAFGRVTLEYMAIGKPVLGANSGAAPELIKSSKNGFLFKTDDPDDLVKVLLNYAENPELISKHGKASQQLAHQLMSGAHTADKLYKKIRATLAAPSDSQQSTATPDEWNSYPILMNRSTKKPRSNLARHLFVSTKLLLKILYIHLNSRR